jgi:hypothetical protein
MTLALGYPNNGDAVGFVLGTGGGSKRGITCFFPVDDFEQTNEKVSMILAGVTSASISSSAAWSTARAAPIGSAAG